MPIASSLLLLSRFFIALLCLFPFTALAQPPDPTPPVTRLETIVATASSTEQNLRQAPASITVITAQDLKDRPVHNLAEALQHVPGLTLKGIGINRKGISLRGMDTSYTLVLVNGRRINPSINAIAHSNLDLNWVAADQIERIEVIRGPMSSLYGSEALGGTINIITKGKRDEWSGELGSYLTQAIDDLASDSTIFHASVGGPLIKDKLYLNLSGEQQYQGQVLMPIQGQALRPSYLEGRRSRQSNIRLTWYITPEHEFNLNHMSGQEDSQRQVIGTQVIRQPKRRPLQTQYPYNAQDAIQREQTSLDYKGQWSWGQTLASLYSSNLERKNTRSDMPELTHQKLSETVFDVKAHIPLGEQHLLTAGTEWRQEKLHDQGFKGTGKSALVHRALFLQDEYRLTPDWIITAGTRLDLHERFGSQHSPRLYSVYPLSDSLTLKGGIGKGFKAPTLKQLSPHYASAGRGGFFTVQGNPNLKPETSTNMELGLMYETDHLFFEGTVFKNTLKNKIAYHCLEFCGQRGLEQGNYQNIDRAYYTGAEFSGSYYLFNNLKLKLSYTYLDARDNDRQLISLTPRHTGSIGINWQAHDNVSLGASMNYIGSQYLRPDSEKSKLAASQIYNLQAAYQLNKNLRVSANIENLTNKKFIDDDKVSTYAEPGRRISLGLSLSF